MVKYKFYHFLATKLKVILVIS